MLGHSIYIGGGGAPGWVVLPAGSPAIALATPYLMIRGLTMIPQMIVTVGFSTFRGLVDTVAFGSNIIRVAFGSNLIRVAFGSNLIRVILLPVLIFKFGMGLVGAGMKP
ncbi:hypothetical protein T484DRAFT_1771431 [Baffinella frigidus]|nr:hypothetical protein T484DRAFT_1771431 [Cryptophyta sp. CCMP2293]